MLKSVMLAVVGLLLASTLPAAANVKMAPGINSNASTANVVLAQYNRRSRARRDRRVRPRTNTRRRFVPGRRYRSAPRNWRRYRARPWNWRSRGCIAVGPLWFCP
ncbi:MAG: hypothetical protein RLZ98_1777 [Pseudomonadota bacterium]|jgi:hypothetical protein